MAAQRVRVNLKAVRASVGTIATVGKHVVSAVDWRIARADQQCDKIGVSSWNWSYRNDGGVYGEGGRIYGPPCPRRDTAVEKNWAALLIYLSSPSRFWATSW
ncbi:hypothetical protein FQN60_009267 [Etheostoma spectabile]|uniref:Uncharacterized protein n=1 Tax=Etheostoma spectabile TaxID=54343 RepID=A0A5J5DIM8_9PERO|nr:hypothetical protein FQN60_009267 [Etheostoma spectabile]